MYIAKQNESKKSIRNISNVLFFIGAIIGIGIAGNCDAYQNYQMSKVLIYSIITAICFLPYLLIFIHEDSEEEEEHDKAKM